MGWQENEWRWKCRDFPSPTRNFPQPQWDGGPLESRIPFCSTPSRVWEMPFNSSVTCRWWSNGAGKSSLNVRPICNGYCEHCPRIAKSWLEVHPCRHFDLHCPLLSLPLVFGTTLENIPNTVPYVYADMQDARKFQEPLDDYSPGLKVGLVWAGSPTNLRSQPFDEVNEFCPAGPGAWRTFL